MKYRLLWLIMICFTISAGVVSIAPLNAAELFNRPKGQIGGQKKAPTLFNKKGSGGTTAKGRPTLFNSKGGVHPTRMDFSGIESLASYDHVEKMKQGTSEIYARLDPFTLKKRRASVDHALQSEYTIRKQTANYMKKILKEDAAFRANAEREHAKALEEYYKRKEAGDGASARASGSFNGSKGHKKGVIKREDGMKKPKRLFNVPD